MAARNEYLELKKKHENEINAFPMAFAFNSEQFAEGMCQLGLSPTETNKIEFFGGGGFYRKTDEKRLYEMFDRHNKEIEDAIAADATGQGFIYKMFLYELCNHEYGYTRDVEETLDSLGLTEEDVYENECLKHGLLKACKEIENWE